MTEVIALSHMRTEVVIEKFGLMARCVRLGNHPSIATNFAVQLPAIGIDDRRDQSIRIIGLGPLTAVHVLYRGQPDFRLILERRLPQTVLTGRAHHTTVPVILIGEAVAVSVGQSREAFLSVV